MKVLIDMNLSPRWVDALTTAGVEATHWSRVGNLAAPDTEIMAFAKLHDYVVLTHDLDFSAILAATHGAKPSVIQLRTDSTTPAVIAQRTIAAIVHLQSELANGALLTIEPDRNRVRILPLAIKQPDVPEQ